MHCGLTYKRWIALVIPVVLLPTITLLGEDQPAENARRTFQYKQDFLPMDSRRMQAIEAYAKAIATEGEPTKEDLKKAGEAYLKELTPETRLPIIAKLTLTVGPG